MDPVVLRALAEHIDQALQEDGADQQVGGGIGIERSEPAETLLGCEMVCDRAHEHVAAQGRPMDLGHESMEQGWITDEVGEHRQDGYLELVRPSNEVVYAILRGACTGDRQAGDVLLEEVFEAPKEARDEQLGLVGEVVVEDAVGQPCRSSDVAARDRLRPALSQEGIGRVKEAPADLERRCRTTSAGPGGRVAHIDVW
jgi:hypothetical protein